MNGLDDDPPDTACFFFLFLGESDTEGVLRPLPSPVPYCPPPLLGHDPRRFLLSHHLHLHFHTTPAPSTAALAASCCLPHWPPPGWLYRHARAGLRMRLERCSYMGTLVLENTSFSSQRAQAVRRTLRAPSRALPSFSALHPPHDSERDNITNGSFHPQVLESRLDGIS